MQSNVNNFEIQITGISDSDNLLFYLGFMLLLLNQISFPKRFVNKFLSFWSHALLFCLILEYSNLINFLKNITFHVLFRDLVNTARWI